MLVHKLFEFPVEWIPAVRNKVEIIFSSKDHLVLLQLLIKNNKCVLYIWVLFFPPQPVVQVKTVSSVWLYFLLESTTEKLTNNRSSRQRCSIKIVVLKNFAKFTGKHLCHSLFFNIVAGLRPQAFSWWKHRCFL